MKYYFYFSFFPIGILKIDCDNNAVSKIQKVPAVIKDEFYRETVFSRAVCRQLDEYFAGRRRDFDVLLDLRGTDFQMSVWREMGRIPYGETRSYKDIAHAIGKPKACRAVGRASQCNPILIIVPCHRVLGASGMMVGYAGGIEMKKKLLLLEKNIAGLDAGTGVLLV